MYFGYPAAHEGDAQRAVLAGLAIQQAIEHFNPRLHRRYGRQLAVRIGIHTGVVIVGDVGAGDAREQLALGEAPNVAARVQGLARPNTVVVSSATYRLIAGFFECRELGQRRLKGMPQPVALYQVLNVSTARSRLDVANPERLTPLTGREAELRKLIHGWDQTIGGAGKVALIKGEPGIGKSRLVNAVEQHVAQDPRAWLTIARCSPHHQNSAFYPVVDLLERVVLQFQPSEPAQRRLQKLEGWLAQYGVDAAEGLPLLAPLLSLPGEARAGPSLSPAERKTRTMTLLVDILLLIAARQPVLFVIEDVHWADPSTLDLLDLLTSRSTSVALLLVLTCRPEFSTRWQAADVLEMELKRLPPAASTDIVTWVAGGKTLPAQVVELLLAKTDGIPLFVEELTKTVLQSGALQEVPGGYQLAGSMEDLTVPETLQDSLMARLDRLGEAKQLAQVAAAIGRECDEELLTAATGLESAQLKDQLAALAEAELIDWPRETAGRRALVFRHALIQDAAYQTMLRGQRRAIHGRIADALERRFPEVAQARPEILAQHLTSARRMPRAVDAWLQAAERASERSGSLEAISHSQRGLDLLAELPLTPARELKELAFHLRRAGMLRVSRGFAAPETGAAYQQARELCARVGDEEHLIPTLNGLYSFHLVHDQYDQAGEVAQELLKLALQHGNETYQMIGHRAVGAVLLHTGRPRPATEHLQRSLELYDLDKHAADAYLYGTDHAEIASSFLALSLWLVGKPQQALQRQQWAVQHSEQLGHQQTLAQALTYLCFLGTLARDWRLVQGHLARLREVSSTTVFRMLHVAAGFWEGAAIGFQGQPAQGARLLQETREAYQTTGAHNYQPFILALIAELLGEAGAVDEGLAVLADAREIFESNNERLAEPENHRVAGLLLAKQAADEAESELRRAIDLANERGATMLALRASTSLAQLLRDQHRACEVGDLLRSALAQVEGTRRWWDIAQAQDVLAGLEPTAL